MPTVAKSTEPRHARVVALRAVPVGLRLAAAGGFAGMVTNSLLHPLDTVKTVRQADPRRHTTMLSTLRAIVATRGARALYAGLLPALIGSSISSSIYFGVYEFAKARFLRAFPGRWEADARLRVPLTGVSAAAGNVSSSVLLVPKEVVKQRMQSGVATSANPLAVAADLVRTSGVRGLYRGYKATLLRNVPSTALRFAAYEEAKRVVRLTRPRARRDDPLSAPEFVAAGSVAGMFSSACTTPMDVIKTRYATGRIAQGAPLLPAFGQIVRAEGVQGLFTGIRPRVIWSALFAAIGFTSYEICKKMLVGAEREQKQKLQKKQRVATSEQRAVPVATRGRREGSAR